MNAVLMELGFLQRLRESPLWPRVAAIFGTSAGALAGTMAALDRLDELEEFLLALRAEEAFRPNRLWRLPLLGIHDYALPRTIEERLGDQVEAARRLRDAPIELVVVATDVTGDEAPDAADELELVYSARTADPEVFAQAVLASAAVSGLVLPVPVGDRLATDGGWVRNYPLAHAYDHPEIELIVAFRYLPRYPRTGFDPLERLRRRVKRLPPVPPVKALLAELDEAEERGARGEPRFAQARFPFRHERELPRITVLGTLAGVSLEPGLRSSAEWSEDAKRALIRRGYELADLELSRGLDAAADAS
jgi:predicted acylesterase/phospholipase RssA